MREVPQSRKQNRPRSADLDKRTQRPSSTDTEAKSSSAASNSPKRIVPKSPKNAPARPLKSTKSGLTAREARGTNDSTRDFADFIRSTAPDDDVAGRPPPIRAQDKPTAATALSSHRTSSATSPNVSRSPENSPTFKDRAPPSTRTNNTRANKLLYQPREARTAEREGNRELIAFLNDGPPMPPPGATVGQARSVETIGSGRTVERMSSTNRSSSQTSNSFAESYTSRSGLLGKRTSAVLKSEPKSPAEPTKHTPTSAPINNTGGPIRKQRRIKDPYAIDDDDFEDEDRLTDLQPREENLMDFLKNSEPPSDSVNGRGSNNRGPNNSGGSSRPSFGTSSSAIGRPSSRPLSPSGGNVERPSRSTSLRMGVSPHDALPDFLRDSRAEGTSSQASSDPDLNTSKSRSSLTRGASRSDRGMKSFFRRIGVNG